MGGVLTEHFGIAVTFLAMGGLNLLAFLIALFLLPESSRRKAGERYNLSFKEMGASSMVRGLFSFRVAEALGRGGISTFLPIFAAALGLSTSIIGTLLTINILSVTMFMPLGGLIADRFGRRTLTIIGSVLFAILLATIPLINGFWLLLGVLLIQGLTSAVSMPASSALAVEEGRKYGMGSTMSMLFLAMSIGMALGPIISGGIADLLNIDSVFYFGAAIGLTGTALFYWFTRGYR